MGTGYTRNDTSNNIADGNIINAADFDGEYDAIEAAFNSSTGHTHDGTSAEGAPITVLGPSQEFVASSSEVKPSTNAGLDLGTSALKFKDLYLDGTAYIDGLGGNLLVDTTNALQFRDAQLAINSSADGQLDIAADTTAKITSPEVIVTDDFRLQSDAAILTFGADDDVSVTHVADTGLDAKAASGFVLKLQTGDTTVESGNTLGKISFNAPNEAGGTDAILVGAEIEAAAEATFSSTDNSTALVFKTNTSAAATERMRIKSDGDIVTQGANYTMTWDHSADTLRFADSAKATFGADDDLQIYHDGADSYIDDAGTGNLTIRANQINFDKYTGEAMARFRADGNTELFYDNSAKLATTTDGIDVTGDISVGNLNLITNTISSTDTNGDINLSPNGTGTVVINTDLDVDNININGNSITSTDTNGDINITPNGTGKVNIAGGFVPSEINLTSTDAGATAGPVFELHRNSASPADNDLIGAIDFAGQDSGGNKVIYASIDAQIMDATDTTEDGRLDFITQVAGSNYSRMRFDPTETVFNEAGTNLDFRIEGDNEPNLFFVDAANDRIGIGTTTPGAEFVVSGTSRFEKGATGASVVVTGSGSNMQLSTDGSAYFEFKNSTDSDPYMIFKGSTYEGFRLGGGAIFNEQSRSVDFRVESDNQAHMLFVDASADAVGINTSTPRTQLDVSGAISLNAYTVMSKFASNNDVISFNYTIDQSASTLTPKYAGASSAGGSFLHMESGGSGTLDFRAAQHGTDGTAFSYQDAGRFMTLRPTAKSEGELIVNQDSDNIDFRVESDGYAHMLFVDASSNYIAMGDSARISDGRLNIRSDLSGTYTENENSTNGGLTLYNMRDDDTSQGHIGITFRVSRDGESSNSLGVISYVQPSYSSFAGRFIHRTRSSNGTYYEGFRLDSQAGAIFNEESHNHNDFRVESDSETHALYVDSGSNYVQFGNEKIIHNDVSIRRVSFSVPASTNRRVRLTLGNYHAGRVVVQALRTNSGNSFVYWDGYVNNNNNVGYSHQTNARTGGGTISYTFTNNNNGTFDWDFNNSGSTGTGSIMFYEATGDATITVTTY